MPRAYTIYVVADGLHDGEPIQAFTVKKEMEAWLRLNPTPEWPNRYKVTALKDGGRDGRVRSEATNPRLTPV